MKRILTLLVMFAMSVTMSVPAFADYKTDILNGNKAYKAKSWEQALSYYKKAYGEKPSAQLKALIAAIENKLAASNDKTEPVKQIQAKKPEKPFDAGPVFLTAADLVIAGAAGFMIFYGSSAQDDYNKLYAEINSTTQANYDRLLKKQKDTYTIMTIETAAVSAASIALVYTLADVFITHGVFKQDVSVKPGMSPGLASITIGRNF